MVGFALAASTPNLAAAAPDANVATPVETATRSLRDARDRLAEDGLDLQMFLTLDETVAPFGASQTGEWVVRGLVDATVTLDGDKVLGWTGGVVHLGLQGLVGQDGTDLLGEVQTFDNIDAPSFAAASEAWVQQSVLGDRLRFKVGRIEANSEFATIEDTSVAVAVRTRRTFVHSSMGFSPTIARMPSYPLQSLGLVVTGRPTRTTRLAAGAFDATHYPSLLSSLPRRSDDPVLATTILLAEADQGWQIGPTRLEGRVVGGGWLLLGAQACAEPPCAQRHGAGAYATASQSLWRIGETDRGVGVFGQYGWAPAAVNPIRHHGALGAVWTGIGRRRGDIVGLAGSWVGIGRPLRSETALELFYRFRVDRYVWAQPDVQYVIDPGGRDPDGLALTLRIAVDL